MVISGNNLVINGTTVEAADLINVASITSDVQTQLNSKANTSTVNSQVWTYSQMPAGSVLQVVSVEDRTRIQINTHDPVNLMSISITPRSSSSKILINISVAIGDTDDFGLKLYRNSTAIKGTGYSSEYSDPDCFIGNDQFEMATYEIYTQSWSFVDLPNLSSVITYTLKSDSKGGNTGLFNYNRCNAGTGAGVSTMTLMEIAN